MIKDRIVTGVLAVVLAVGGMLGGSLISRMAYGGEAYADAKSQVGEGMKATGLNSGNSTDLKKLIPKIINGILYAVGVLAVVMVIYGGVQYAMSAGDQGKVTSAKNTIIYGLVGMVIAVMAYAIVNFVLTQVTS